ncbi:hypothetical protein As57867_017366, partial [Aphanomyces stellatus]
MHVRVLPQGQSAAPLGPRSSIRNVCGFAYVALSLGLSVVYLTLLQPAFSNDLWWPHYNVTGHQALLIDLFNVALATQANGTIDLLAPWAVIDKSYNSSVATAAIYPTYVRRLMWAEFTSVEYAVVNLRSMSGFWSLWMCTQYCWVDLQRQFEVAHTAGRQQRCADRYRANGAVYMETMLRNQIWDDFIANYGGDGGMFTVSLQAWLEQVPSGQTWLEATSTARLTTTVAQEMAYWRTQNITSYKLQWQNRIQSGMAESMVVENALGIRQTIVLKNLPTTTEAWTSYTMYWFAVDDLTILQGENQSLIRSADNAFVTSPSATFESLIGLQDADGNFVNQVKAFRAAVGPFNSIDAYYVPVPLELIALHQVFFVSLSLELATSSLFSVAVDMLVDFTLTPTPPAWVGTTWSYYGGNPLCLFGEPQPYIQESFNVFDTCATQRPLVVHFSKRSSVFGVLLTPRDAVEVACSLSPSVVSCSNYIDSTIDAVALLASVSTAVADYVAPATTSIAAMDIGIMQYASTDDETMNWALLHQPLLQDTGWTLYSWVYLYDWVDGAREVVSFQGDEDSIVLISAADAPLLFPSGTQSSVTTATQFIYLSVAYVTGSLAFVAIGCLVCAVHVRFQMHGANLFWFHRVVGSMWIGRSLLLARAVTAIILLSTSQVQPTTGQTKSSSTYTRFESRPRALLPTMIVCGEATYVLYVLHDVLTVTLHGMTRTYGPLSCILAWTALLFVDIVAPVQPIATLHRECSSRDMDQSVTCESGTLQLGSYHRFCVIFSIELLAFAVAFSVVWAYHRRVHKLHAAGDRHVLGVADVFFSLSGDCHDQKHWQVDKVSCVLAGLIPCAFAGTHYTLDVKLWVLQIDTISDTRWSKSFVRHRTDTSSLHSHQSTDQRPAHIQQSTNSSRLVVTVMGILYALATILSSVSYLQVSQVNLANDLFWASFNMTGAHAFLANWLNQQLALGRNDSLFQINSDSINRDGTYDQPTASVQSAANFGSLMQHTDLNTIEAAIVSLRHSDGCSVPWIFSQYCFVDFDQRWHMANSATRQARCQAMVANGAVFLEPALRNIDFNGFHRCWGTAFDVAIASEVKSTDAGRSWLATIQSHDLDDIPVEVAYWQKYNVARFETQWQNFKRIGLVNMYSVSNMFGTPYPFTLQYQNSSFRMHKATSLKMYWGLANDFVAISHNTSGIGGRSLVRSSPVFAFANTSLESVLRANGTLKT